MLRNSMHAAAFLALAAAALGAIPQAGGPLPIPPGTPIHEAHMRFDPASGTYVRVPDTIGLGTEPSVYDNTCSLGNVLPLLSAAQNGGAESRAAGDWGAIPGVDYPGDATCVTGCDIDYDISAFTIGYCTATAAPVSAVVHFWDIPQSSCTGTTLIGGVTPPATPTIFSASLTGLPRAPVPGPMACYQVTIDLPHPAALRIRGATNIVPGANFGDRFAWSIQMPGTTGQDGPLIAGAPATPPCGYCTGTIWEFGNQSPNPGTGFGQDNHVFTDDYGGTIPADDCVQFPGGNPWAGLYLELASSKVCSLAVASSNFCDASDGSAAFCPCSNPGTNNTGCDNAQGTGGVGVQVVAQDPVLNRATLLGFGFPMGASPAAVVIRADALDPAAPIVFGDGLRCIGTPLVRLAGTLASGGSSVHEIGHSPMAGPGFFYYQIWYRNQPAGFCNLLPGTLAYNLSNGQRIFWMQ